MEDEMNLGELYKESIEDNQTRKILLIIEKCENLDEAIKKVEALLSK